MRAKKYRPESERYKREVLNMGELSKLPNIGKAVEAQLIQVGIETRRLCGKSVPKLRG